MSGDTNDGNGENGGEALRHSQEPRRLLLRSIVILEYRCKEYQCRAGPTQKMRNAYKKATTGEALVATWFGRGAWQNLPSLRDKTISALGIAEIGVSIVLVAIGLALFFYLLFKNEYTPDQVLLVTQQVSALDELECDYFRDVPLDSLQARLRHSNAALGSVLTGIPDPKEDWVFDRIRRLTGSGA